MQVQVLDHGYVEFIEAWGTGKSGKDLIGIRGGDTCVEQDYERGIIEAARQSTQGTFRSWDEPDENGRTDQKLLEFLYEKAHNGPFEFAGMIIEVKAPILVFREWHRHRTQSYNEMSARYAPLPNTNYVPSLERLMMGAGSNKQAQGTGAVLDANSAKSFRMSLLHGYEEADIRYQEALHMGVPKELARAILPVGRYSKMRASANLRNWLAFMTLRCDPAAQWEIQQYAHVVAASIMRVFPRTYAEWIGR